MFLWEHIPKNKYIHEYLTISICLVTIFKIIHFLFRYFEPLRQKVKTVDESISEARLALGSSEWLNNDNMLHNARQKLIHYVCTTAHTRQCSLTPIKKFFWSVELPKVTSPAAKLLVLILAMLEGAQTACMTSYWPQVNIMFASAVFCDNYFWGIMWA